MSEKKYTTLTVLTYFIAFLAPAFGPTLEIRIILTILTYLIGSIVMIRLYKKTSQPLSFEANPMSRGRIITLGIIGIFLAILLQNVMITIELYFDGQVDSANTQGILELIFQNPLMILAVMIGGPIMEEFVFRRAIMGMVTRRSNLWLGVLVSAVLFALMHQAGHWLLYSALGALFSLQYIITGSIWTSVISHVGMNTLVILANVIVEVYNLPVK